MKITIAILGWASRTLSPSTGKSERNVLKMDYTKYGFLFWFLMKLDNIIWKYLFTVKVENNIKI